VFDDGSASYKRPLIAVIALVLVLFFSCGKDSDQPAYTEPHDVDLIRGYVEGYIQNHGESGLRSAFDNSSDAGRIIVLDQIHLLYQRSLAGIDNEEITLSRESAFNYMIDGLKSQNGAVQKRSALYLYQDKLPETESDIDKLTQLLPSVPLDVARELWTVFTRDDLAPFISDSLLGDGLDSECGAEAMSVLYVKYANAGDASFDVLHKLLLSSNLSAVRWALRKLAYEFDFDENKPGESSVSDAQRRLTLLSNSTAFGKLHSFEKKMISVLSPKLNALYFREKSDDSVLLADNTHSPKRPVAEDASSRSGVATVPEEPAKPEEVAKPEEAKPEEAKLEEAVKPEEAKPEQPEESIGFIAPLEEGLAEDGVEQKGEETVAPVDEVKLKVHKNVELSWSSLSDQKELFGIKDIEAYDWDKQIFRLKLDTAVRLLAASRTWNDSEPFAVKDGVQTIYEGILVTSHSTDPFVGPTIHLDRHVFDADAVSPPLFEVRGGYLGRYNDDDWNRENGMTGVKNTFLNYMLEDAGVLKTIEYSEIEPIKMITTAVKFGNPQALTAGVQVYLDTFIIGQKALFHIMFKKGGYFPEKAQSIELLVTLNSNNQRFGAQIPVKNLPLDILEKGYLCEFEPWDANVILKGVDPQPGSAEFSVMVILNDKKGNPLTFCEIPSMSVVIQPGK